MKRKIIEDLKSGRFEITVHAAIRMSERVVAKEDLEGEIMEVICDYLDETLIVTVLTKEEIL